ncbi:pyridoxine 5'-phosphate synthase [Pseudodesulfovibrio sediminis]|uniref:Pyridoxine 5'-phosphate synthase n=1 Tax=Pseudodesulfovibrio sediminis TaxID=2810563 RepID=A0ABM9SEF4_9BACT|nr:pyridoxine 5'-phosphate synthase [Pseudodesulfovibrio sediminis]BCS87051.1 pyridoxine 5'-phosphate synthase [Pseudodesulfovibrio sediminis]
MPVLVVNVDHVATLRQARMGIEPEPVTAAYMAEMAGATGIIVHLREDRRHIQDRDVELIKQTCNTRLHLEMAATKEMQGIALDINPEMVCLVPEKRQELTTEGGLNCIGREQELTDYLAPIHEQGIRSSLFIDADPKQIEAAHKTGAEFIEIHTGHYADAKKNDERNVELEKILKGIALAQDIGLKVNLGHGLNYRNILNFKDVPGIKEYSIGHAIMARAMYVGLDRAVRDMAELVRTFAD